jgi:ABC-type antimicrobial peptide transport system permease subunit
MRDLIVRSRVLTVFLQRLATVFSGLCLLVVVTGVYAHFTRWVRARHRELGIRQALGARPARLRGAVYTAAGPGLAIGVAVGVAAAWYLGRGAATVLGVDAPGIPLLAAGAAVVSVTALASLVPPAWRVVRYDPRRLLVDE